jgi:hypothetical protein
MLGVVYGRATRMRRRRAVQRVGGATAAIALAFGALVSLGNGTDEARVRVADEPGRQDEAPPPAEPAASDAATGAGSSEPAPGGAAPRPSPKPDPAPGATTGTAPAAVPALPAAQRAQPPELWATATDGTNDAMPNHWYYDVVSASMEFDQGRGAVVFTTRYRTPDAPADQEREARILDSEFAYGSHVYAVSIQESGNQLGPVRIEGQVSCGTCTARFDAAAAVLVVTVPVEVLNREIARHDDSEPLASGADIGELVAVTSRVEGNLPPVDADVSGRGALR